MPHVIDQIAGHAQFRPQNTALTDGCRDIGYGALHQAIRTGTAQLRADAAQVVALALDNGPAWVIADLAVLGAHLPCVPLPGFFTPAQQAHALRDAGADWLITDRPDTCSQLLHDQGIAAERKDDIDLGGWQAAQFRLQPRQSQSFALPRDTAKITYTSGTTGAPKGVCLSGEAMATVAWSLVAACRMTPDDRHLSLLPLPVLLENIGGVYAPLIAGGCCVLPPLQYRDVAPAVALACARASTTIMIPHMLQSLVTAVESGAPRPTVLRFLAVGGARVPQILLDRAAQAGLPVYEGYGLSECASVVTLNTPQAHCPGSTGRPLPHAAIRIAGDGEILVKGANLLGYAGEPRPGGAWWPTGDLGHLDADGFIYLTGRKKDIFITAHGRNVAPDWVESELVLQPEIAQAWVHGEARPWNAAIITPRAGATLLSVALAVESANRNLPVYARVRHWLTAHEPFTQANGELTANGRLRRAAIAARYNTLIDRLYKEHDYGLS